RKAEITILSLRSGNVAFYQVIEIKKSIQSFSLYDEIVEGGKYMYLLVVIIRIQITQFALCGIILLFDSLYFDRDDLFVFDKFRYHLLSGLIIVIPEVSHFFFGRNAIRENSFESKMFGNFGFR